MYYIFGSQKTPLKILQELLHLFLTFKVNSEILHQLDIFLAIKTTLLI